MEKLTCPKCGLLDKPDLVPTKIHLGAHCKFCGAWIKWVPQGKKLIFYFGRYKDLPIEEVMDIQYLKWAKENIKKQKADWYLAVQNRISELEFLLK